MKLTKTGKWVAIAIAVVVALAGVLGFLWYVGAAVQEDARAPLDIVVETQAIGGRLLAPCLSHCDLEGTDEDTYIILVDLSDNINYPHYKTNRIILKGLQYSGDLSVARRWHYSVGVITAVDATDINVEWITQGVRNRLAQFNERWWPPEHGLSLEVRNATLENVATNTVSAIDTITSSVYVSTCTCLSGTLPGVGDLILFMDEISDTATLNLFIDVGYDAE